MCPLIDPRPAAVFVLVGRGWRTMRVPPEHSASSKRQREVVRWQQVFHSGTTLRSSLQLGAFVQLVGGRPPLLSINQWINDVPYREEQIFVLTRLLRQHLFRRGCFLPWRALKRQY